MNYFSYYDSLSSESKTFYFQIYKLVLEDFLRNKTNPANLNTTMTLIVDITIKHLN